MSNTYIFTPEQWALVDQKALASFFKDISNESPHSVRRGSRLIFRKHLSPLSIYKYLVGRFGRPNGLMTFLKNQNDSDNLFHWDFLIQAGDHKIWIQGGNRDVHVTITGKKMTAADWVKFVNCLKADFSRCGSEMSRIANRLEKWNLVSNRFALIADACAEHHSVLLENADQPDFVPHKRTTERGIKKYTRQIKTVAHRANALFNSSLSLELITPIFAESYINLVIFMLRKDELKTNNRQYQAFVRQHIDVRIFDLHLKCDHFKDKVDGDSTEFKNFMKVMNRRNDIIHGNIDPQKDTIETVFFDKFTPLYEQGGDPILELFRHKEQIFDAAGVLERYHHIHDFILYLNGLIEDQPRRELELIASESTFGYDLSRQKFGRLFSNIEPMMLFPSKYDDELNVSWKLRQ